MGGLRPPENSALNRCPALGGVSAVVAGIDAGKRWLDAHLELGAETVAVRPDRARRFAEALGLLVKADHEDAKALARYGRLEGLEVTAPLHLALA